MFSLFTYWEVKHMTHARIVLLSAAATCLLPFATPAMAQDHPTRPHHALRIHRIPPGAPTCWPTPSAPSSSRVRPRNTAPNC